MSGRALTPRRNSALLPLVALFGLLQILFGFFQAPPSNILSGLWHIATHEDVLITDYVATVGLGPAFVNSGLVTLIAVMFLRLSDEPPDGYTLVTVGLMSGFSLFGKNIVNIWPVILGTALFALLKRERFSHYINVAMLATCLSPMVSFMGCELHPLAGVLIGIAIGFLMPPVAKYAFRIQNGMNLYSLGFACGLLAMILVPAFKAFGLDPEPAHHWSSGNNLILGCALGVFCLALIVAGLACGPRKALSAYWKLLHTSGRAPSDFLLALGAPPVLINMGVNGLIATGYIVLTGGDLNGATIGGIFTIIGFSGYGKHAFNIVPIMAGVLLGSLLNHVPFNSSSLQLAALFGTTLAPFAGYFGWPFGILAGLIHSSVVLQAGLPLEGMNLYNNGFSGGLIAVVLYPILTSLFPHRRRRNLQDQALFGALESQADQNRAEPDNRQLDEP